MWSGWIWPHTTAFFGCSGFWLLMWTFLSSAFIHRLNKHKLFKLIIIQSVLLSVFYSIYIPISFSTGLYELDSVVQPCNAHQNYLLFIFQSGQSQTKPSLSAFNGLSYNAALALLLALSGGPCAVLYLRYKDAFFMLWALLITRQNDRSAAFFVYILLYYVLALLIIMIVVKDH